MTASMEPLIVINGDVEQVGQLLGDRPASMEPLIVINGDTEKIRRIEWWSRALQWSR